MVSGVFLATLHIAPKSSRALQIIRAPREDQWAPGYYSLLFEEPDGIRFQLNHVPGKGLLA
jgi:hypothetical protein